MGFDFVDFDRSVPCCLPKGFPRESVFGMLEKGPPADPSYDNGVVDNQDKRPSRAPCSHLGPFQLRQGDRLFPVCYRAEAFGEHTAVRSQGGETAPALPKTGLG